ncbi:chymotrypsin-elastase inhibitor ixodidin-like [Anopheles marshallii]|uniref:chymotrypsin-elastase inhibitor ixodidin-like n=1 Tax=Anopheles marshallii TaxID=1521116 RepID=UPI00237B31B5|nr:chymotrypsin-elastase inhibitor ixodidin-like [Anopheles marshallii]
MKVFVVALLGLVLLAGVAYADNAPEEISSEQTEVEEPPCEVVEKCDGQYEEYKCCGKCFQRSCFTKKINCEQKCTKGCYCMEGFVREYEGGKCMPKRLCQVYLRRGFNSG